MNKQQLASKIWESANKMRSKIEANEYKDYILGFMFYKFLSEKEERFCLQAGFTSGDMQGLTEEDAETVEYIRTNIGYFISYKNLYSTWIASGSDFGIDNVHDALSAFNRLINKAHNRVFEGIFETLETGLSKLGENAGSQTKAARDLIHLINDIPMDGRQDYDVLGFIYEYLISNFAANAGKKAGEFYTPHEVSLLMSEIVASHLSDKKEIKIYDPTSGSGSLLINIGKAVARRSNSEDGIKYYAQELKQNTYNLTRMNLIMRGILPDNLVTRNGDTLEQDWPYFDETDPTGTYDPLYVDAVVSNPPYSQPWDPTDKEVDGRFDYGLAPKSKADYAFLLHDLYHLRPDGIMTIVLPHGVLFRGGEEGVIRKNLIENRHIEAIIGLPANIFFGTGIPTIVMVLRRKREASDVLIVDASKGFEKVGKNNTLRACDIKKITDVVVGRRELEKFSRLVSIEEVRSNDYNLNIPRYVDSSESSESWDIYATMFGGIPVSELDDLSKYWNAWPGLREVLFTENETPYASLKTEDAKGVMQAQSGVTQFLQQYKQAFGGFDDYLAKRLLEGMEEISVAEEEPIISAEIFKRLEDVALVDPYAAYQSLYDVWGQIAMDLEIIQTEGLQAITQVDPNMVIKTKANKKQEVQEGWVGHIIPFELVQEEILASETSDVKIKKGRLSEIASTYEDLLSNLSEEDKASMVVNEAGDSFVAKEINKQVKQLKGVQVEEGSLEEVILTVSELLKEEKALKSDIKKDEAALHQLTKTTIENLSGNQVQNLLYLKWVQPIIDGLFELPVNVVSEAASKIQALAKKYETTLTELSGEINEAENALADMIDNLTGSDFDMQGLKELQVLLRGE